MNKTKIEWTDWSWNPIKGICPVGCFYCYGKGLYQRFKWKPEIRVADEYPGMISMPLYDRKREVISRKVFVCSMFELFHPLVKKEWRDWIFDIIEYNKHLTFQILTKLPQNIDRAMPDNVWLGVTSTGYPSQDIFKDLNKSHAKIKFISLEPLLTPILLGNWFQNYHFNWIIVGRLTRYGHKYDIERMWVEKIVEKARKYSIPIFLKDNLKDIWGEPLIQEFPE